MKNLTRRGLALAGLLALGALAGCGATKLKGPDVAKKVSSQALAPRGITGARVKCPKETEAKKDAAIKCSVVAGKDRGTVTATVLNEDGKLGRYQSDVKKVQMTVIERNAAEEGKSKGISGAVDCPSDTEPKKGALYFCTADITGSGFGVVVVTQKDEASNVSVRVQRRKLRTAQIERNITKAVKKRGINATVTCPARVTSQKGSVFRCTVRNPANGRTLTIVATQTDDQGNFRLEAK